MTATATATIPASEPRAAGVAERDGVWIAWRDHGDPGAPPVLLVMGFMGSGRAWHRLLPPLARDRRVVAFDNRGTGDSDRPRGPYSMDELAADALAVMDDAGVERAHVVGASMGGMVAQHLALDAPERVLSLTLCCTHAGGRADPPSWRMVASLLLRPLTGAGATFPLVAPLLYAERTRRERPERVRQDLRVRIADATPFATAAAQAAAIVGHDTRARLAELAMPVLVLHGEQDALVPPAAGLELAELIPHAELELLPDCGHVMTTDAEERVTAALLGFLERCG